MDPELKKRKLIATKNGNDSVEEGRLSPRKIIKEDDSSEGHPFYDDDDDDDIDSSSEWDTDENDSLSSDMDETGSLLAPAIIRNEVLEDENGVKIDIITTLADHNLEHIAEKVFSYLNARSLRAASEVSESWKDIVVSGRFWKKLTMRKVQTDNRWAGVATRRKCLDTITQPIVEWTYEDHVFYDKIYEQISGDVDILRANWQESFRKLKTIDIPSCPIGIDFDIDILVVLMMSDQIQIYSRQGPELLKSIDVSGAERVKLMGDFIYCGFSDGSIRVWEWKTGTNITTVQSHSTTTCAMVLCNNSLFTASRGGCIVEWDIISPLEIKMRRKIGEDYPVSPSQPQHLLSITVTPLYVISGFTDTTIKLWHRNVDEYNIEPNFTLRKHKAKVTSLQHNPEFLVSGDGDGVVILWILDDMMVWKVIQAHDCLVVSLQLNSSYLLSASMAGQAKIWSLKNLKVPREPKPTDILPGAIIFCLGADDFTAVTASGCEVIDIFDYLTLSPKKFIQQYKKKLKATCNK